MTELLQYPFRVLIVDDELDLWANPMRQLLGYAAKEARLGALQIDIAVDQREAERLLASQHFHLVSLDMRLPEKAGEALSVATGVRLARSFPYAGFPKQLVYSQTLRPEDISQNPGEAVRVLRIPADLYAKSTGGDRHPEPQGVEVLKASEWAQRVAGSLSSDRKELGPSSRGSSAEFQRLTVVGAYLEFGPDLLPPILARHVQELANQWEARGSERVDAAIRFIECVARLSLVQTGAFLTLEGHDTELPSDHRMASCLGTIERWRAKLTDWNWASFLSGSAIAALRKALDMRNEERHTLKIGDPVRAWAMLRVPLQHAMDVAAYWVRHPLCLDLRYSRDGWNSELLAGTREPRQRRPLPAAMDFPGEATHGGAWQSVWRIGGDQPKQQALPWDGWLEQDQRSAYPCWFPAYCDPRGRRVWLDIGTGDKRTF